MIATENICPFCGKAVQTTALQGICPECMLKAGLVETGEVGPDGTVVGKPLPQPVPGIEEIAPHFPQLEILECLGRGGMGAVYKARQPKLDRFVALKILTRRQANGITDTEFAARFQQEARALARLNHADIVAVYDFGEAGGFHYLLMEYVDGLTLRQLLQTRTISPEEALAIVPKICEALQFAHERGIVHRDIKPENILLDKQGRVKIADFGIAKILGTTTAGASLTGAKDVIGTPHYMAPEQIEKPTKVDHRADIYSLGVVFYEMLTGELPLGNFQRPSRKVQVDVRLDEVVLHALEKEPERRYQHASEVKTDVETIAAGRKSEIRNPKSEVEARLDFLEQRRQRMLNYGFLASLIGLPVSVALGLPYLAVVAVAGIVIGGFKLQWFERGGTRRFLRIIGYHGSASSEDTGRAESGGARTTRSTVIAALPWVSAARWSARVLGTLLLLFYGVFILAEGLPPIASQSEGVQLNFVALALMPLGFVIGWKREGAAALLIAAGWTLWHISEGRMQWNFFQTPLPVAALYGFCWWATHGGKTRVVVAAVTTLVVFLGLGLLFVPTSVFVRGAILDAQSGKPIPNAELRILPRSSRSLEKGDPPNARANADGEFTLYVGWYEKQKELALSASGYGTVTTNLGPRNLGQRNVRRSFQLLPAMHSLDAGDGSVPPVVVLTVPESGTANVDPALTEIRVTFSEPMQDRSWSWAKWTDDSFPQMRGQARFLEDRRTCVLPVQLRPGKVYALWINSERHHKFKDQQGQPAVPYLLIFQTK